MTYAYPENISNMTDIFTWTNSVTDNWFAPVILFVVFIVGFLALKSGYSTAKALAPASFMVMLLAIFFRVIGLISNAVLIASIVICIVSIVWLWFEGKQDY